METDHIGGWGVVIGASSDNNLFLNFDSHHNEDPYSTADPYGGADGFESGSHMPGQTSTNNTFRGCRAWSNSDDGWDFRVANGLFILDNCWSFWNGYVPSTVGKTWAPAGNGEGFKLGGIVGENIPETRRIVKNSLSFENRYAGVEATPNDGYEGVEVYNSVFYKDATGVNFIDNYANILENNIAYANTEQNVDWVSTLIVNKNNKFPDSNFDTLPNIYISDSDFLSVDSTGMDGSRNADGSLPNLPFLHLAKGSKLIDAGVNVGLPFKGNAPDVGAYESNY